MTTTSSTVETKYAKCGDTHIAYQVSGEGPLDLVVIGGLYASIDAFYAHNPRFDEFRRKLSSIARLIVFDKRGIGSSDRTVGAPSLEERMEDVRAVMDATGSSCAAIYGMADGGAMSLLFAATYPERTFALALLRPKVRYVWGPDFPSAPTREEYERETERMVRGWGSVEGMRDGSTRWGTVAFEDEAERARILRLSASPGAIAALRRMNMEIDVRSVLPAIHVPTLVMHRPPDAWDADETQDIAHAKYIAEHVPNLRVVEIDGEVPWMEAAGPELEKFLPEAWEARGKHRDEPQRVLSTVLFTDLVGSTARAVALGPRWQDVLAEHNAAIRRELGRFSGREIDTAGDGFFASGFDGPARAIRCASAIRDSVQSLGLEIRVGVHTGECDLVDGKLSGLAVNIGSRVADQAMPGEVLVSGTVRDLVAGSGIEFEPRGLRDLKGLGEWPLFAVADSPPAPAA